MSKFHRFRQLCRCIGILACITALVGIILSASEHTLLGYSLVSIGVVSLLVVITLIAAKNSCFLWQLLVNLPRLDRINN